ncbi:MAG: Gfo/Idh/MocA family oxidoreductase [Erysipelotrichaceae bacterium]|nr:Gfo/Idh/MocA family oxidoreductase [Erysipelotrichaceae bacterium]
MKVALIGVGVIGKVHLNVITNTDVELVGVCDIDESKLLNYQESIRFTDYKLMIDTTYPDIVHICTPHYLHKEMIIYALERNVNVFCEKPLCISNEELSELIEVISKSRAQLGVCYQNRYNPSTIFVKNYLKDKEVDSIYGELRWHRDEKYYSQGYWRGKKKYEGGGVLINQAIHTIDLMQYFYKVPSYLVSEISNQSLIGIIDVEDNASINSVDNKFKLVASNSSDKDYPIRIVINTKDEVIKIESNKVTINEKVYECEKLNILPHAKESYGGGHAYIINDFYRCIKENKKFSIDLFEASKSLKIVLASYKSEGKEIKVE